MAGYFAVKQLFEKVMWGDPVPAGVELSESQLAGQRQRGETLVTRVVEDLLKIVYEHYGCF